MKILLSTIRQSMSNRAFYAGLLGKTKGQAGAYLMRLGLFLGVVSAILSLLVAVPSASKALRSMESAGMEFYPKGLVVTIENGTASTNSKDEPILVPFKDEWKNEWKKAEKTDSLKGMPILDNMLAIDTRTNASLESFKNLKSAILLSKDSIVAYKENGQVVVQSLVGFPKVTVTEALFQKILSFIPYIVFLIPFAFFIIPIFYTAISLLYLFLIALIFFLVSKLVKLNYSFSDAYVVCAYAATLPIVITTLLIVFSVPLRIPFFFTFATLIIASIFARKKDAVISASDNIA